MVINSIDAPVLKKMIIAGARSLESKKEWVNELNVFPVPDGDTGTNMSLTIMSAVREIENIEDFSMKTLSKAISSGSLRGARGNSGVILSQLFRGFTKEIKTVEEIDALVFAAACDRAVETAYKAVMKPKEGTILTVARGMAEKANELAAENEDFVYIIDEVIKHGDEILLETPELLPVLKEAGVVDSGGQGLMQIVKGAYDALLGREVDYFAEQEEEPGEVTFEYNVSFKIVLNSDLAPYDDETFKAALSDLDDICELKSDSKAVSARVETNEPGDVINEALKFGSVVCVSIENTKTDDPGEIGAEPEIDPGPRKEYGFISVCAGEGLKGIFDGLGVDFVIEGGQTMNPSTDDLLNAIERVNADTIYVLPNNKNIIMAAEQAAKLTKDKNVIVVPSKTVPQGITAIINFIPDLSGEENLENMTAEIKNVKTGQVTYAVRDTSIDDRVIKQGNIMGIADDGIKAVGLEITETAFDLVKAMTDDESEIISLYFGAGVTADDADTLLSMVSEEFPQLDVELNEGGQPVYYYIISVE